MDEEKQLTPPQNDDERNELRYQASEGRLIREMFLTKGWKEVIEPRLMQRKTNLINSIGAPTDLREFITLQQAICSIDNLLSFVRASIELGKIANKRLEIEHRDSQNTDEAG